MKERAPSITRLLMCVRDEVRRVQSHYRMCKQNERVEIEGKPDGKKVTLPPNKGLKPLPPLAELVEAELRHIRKVRIMVRVMVRIGVRVRGRGRVS